MFVEWLAFSFGYLNPLWYHGNRVPLEPVLEGISSLQITMISNEESL